MYVCMYYKQEYWHNKKTCLQNWVTILVLAAVETHRQTNPHAQRDDVQNSTRLLVVNRDS